MGVKRSGAIERVLQRIFVPLFLIAGVIVAAGFFFPDFIGERIDDRWWLTVALVFFGSALGYLAVLPAPEEDEQSETDGTYFLRVRRLGVFGNVKTFLANHDPITFWIPVVVLGVFFVLQWVAESTLLALIQTIQQGLTQELGWIFVFVMTGSVVVCLYLVGSRWGGMRLGGPDATPSYTYPVYFTMFFTAGIAAGIVFSGPAEPIAHFGEPAPYFAVEPETGDAAVASLTYALFHWGFTAWSAYLIIGLPIAYFVYERGAPLRVSAILTPFLGVDNLSSPIAKLVDVMAIFATIGGIATSVALVSQQFLIGVEFQWDVSLNLLGPLLFVSGLTVIFVLSAQSGVHRGIRRIAGINIVLFAAFTILLFILGPTATIISSGTSATGNYALHFIPLSLEFGTEWVSNWTIWNWAWWFSWAPFAGLFLAALSRGRTIRTVILTGMVATGLATIVWFLVVGGTALDIQQSGERDILEAIRTHESGNAVAGFPLLDALSLNDLMIFVFLALIIVFMTTSADTSTLVVSILATQTKEAPTTASIIFWGIFQGIVALVVIITGSGALLQGAAVLTGGPFAIFGVIAVVGLAIGLRADGTPGKSLHRTVIDRIRR